MINLDELEALEKGATPGPWKWFKTPGEESYEVLAGPLVDFRYPSIDPMVVMTDGSACGEYSPEIGSEDPNGNLIPAMRNALPDLIAELRAARMLVQWVRGCEAQPDEIYCDVNPEDCDHCTGMAFLADYDDAVKEKL